MKRWIITICLFIASGCLTAASNSDSYKQLLKQQLDTTTNDTLRLRLLFDLCEQSIAQPEERAVYADRMLSEANRLGSAKYQCEAYLVHVVIAYNNYDTTGIDKWLPLLEPVARKEKMYFHLFQGKFCKVNMLLLKEQYELQEKEALKMLKEAEELNSRQGIIMAYQCLAYNYHFTHRNAKAIEVLEKAYQYARDSDDKTVKENLVSTLVVICESARNAPKWLKYLQIQENQYKQAIENKPDTAESYRDVIMLNYISYLQYYIFVDDLTKATQALQNAEKYYSDDYSPLYRQDYHKARCNYYMWIDDMDKALAETDAALAIGKSMLNINYYSTLITKAYILYLVGRPKEALAIYRETLAAKDSVQTEIVNKQTEHIRNSYNADQLLLEKGKIQRQEQLAFFIPLCLLIIVLVIFMVHFFRVGFKLRKSEKEMAKMAHDVEQANIAKENFLSNINSAIRGPLDSIVNSSYLLSSDEQIEKDEKERLSRLIGETSANLQTMINDILLLSKLEAGMMKFNVEELDVNIFLRGIVDKESTNTGFPVSIALQEESAYSLQIDPSQFAQMISSLITSVVDGCKKISISEKITQEGYLAITVQGAGLATPTPSQDIMIRNEINRLLTVRFNGTYEIYPEAEIPYIVFVLPVNQANAA